MLSSGGFTAACLQAIAKGGSSILGHPGQTRAMFQVSILGHPGQTRAMFQVLTSRRPVHTLMTAEELLPFVPPRTPRSSGYDFYSHVFYVVICYMSIICYMPVICLV